MCGVLDVITDVMFSLTVTEKQRDEERVPYFIVVICWVTIVVPVLLSICQLWRKSRGAWLREDVPRQWMDKYSVVLFILPFLCGSSFIALSVLNCNMFQMGVFSMGLSDSEFSSFNLQRLWTIILLEVMCSIFFLFLS